MKNFDFYFDLDIGDVLTTVGVTVKVGSTTINWAHDFGDLGGEPEGLDCTPLSSLVHLEKAGVVEQEKWTVDYYFNATDYDAIEALKTAGTTQTLEVSFPGGVKFTNSGKVAANYLSAGSVNSVQDAHCVIELSAGWVKTTNP
jgi:hypothetical protein